MDHSNSTRQLEAPRRTERVHPIGGAKAPGERLSRGGAAASAGPRSALDGRSEGATLEPVGWARGRKPRLLDLFSCAGGAAAGYAAAGFEVVGVDIVPQPRYPFEHHVADALEFLREHGHEFEAVHASPPCQAYSTTRHMHSVEHPQLVEPTRALLVELGVPYVIENVPGAPLLDPLVLCGSMFGLGAVDDDGEQLELRRHRLFESNVFLLAPGSGCAHGRHRVAGVYGGGATAKTRRSTTTGRSVGYTPPKRIAEALLGIDWMTLDELAQSIPPAYTEFIGSQLAAALNPRGSNHGGYTPTPTLSQVSA